MYLIKPCPECRKKIRFPIDRGKIEVRCPCGNSFVADPDDPAIYTDGRIDPDIREKKRSEGARKPGLNGYTLSRLKDRAINGVLEYRYRLQNLPMLPAREKARVFLQLAALFIILIFIISLIASL